MTDPLRIDRDQLTAALASIGISTEDLRELHLSPTTVTVTRFRRDPDTGGIAVGDSEVATFTVVIPLTRREA